MPRHFTSQKIAQYFILPVLGAIIIALGIWFIIYLNKRGRRAGREEEAGAGAETEREGGIEMQPPESGVGPRLEEQEPVAAVKPKGVRRLGTTTTIEAGPPPWG